MQVREPVVVRGRVPSFVAVRQLYRVAVDRQRGVDRAFGDPVVWNGGRRRAHRCASPDGSFQAAVAPVQVGLVPDADVADRFPRTQHRRDDSVVSKDRDQHQPALVGAPDKRRILHRPCALRTHDHDRHPRGRESVFDLLNGHSSG